MKRDRRGHRDRERRRRLDDLADPRRRRRARARAPAGRAPGPQLLRCEERHHEPAYEGVPRLVLHADLARRRLRAVEDRLRNAREPIGVEQHAVDVRVPRDHVGIVRLVVVDRDLVPQPLVERVWIGRPVRPAKRGEVDVGCVDWHYRATLPTINRLRGSSRGERRTSTTLLTAGIRSRKLSRREPGPPAGTCTHAALG